MTQAVRMADVCEFMTRHLPEVFSTMLTLEATSISGVEPPRDAERVTGAVGFAGDDVNGVVYLHLDGAFSKRATAAMLGMQPEEIGSEADVNDVVGEITNMLAGGLKSRLCDLGSPCAVSTPAIIRGASFVVEPVPDVARECLGFECCGSRVVVELHLHTN